MSNIITQNTLFFALQAAQQLPCPQAFLDKYKLIKTPATEDTEAVYYTEADGLTIWQAMEKHGGYVLWNYDGSTLKRAKEEILDEENNVIQEEVPANYVSFTVNEFNGTLAIPLVIGFTQWLESTQTSFDPALLLQTRSDWAKFTANVT